MMTMKMLLLLILLILLLLLHQQGSKKTSTRSSFEEREIMIFGAVESQLTIMIIIRIPNTQLRNCCIGYYIR